MAVIIKQENQSDTRRTILYVVIIVVVAIILYALWKYIVLPFSRGELFPPGEVTCTVAPSTPTGLKVSTTSTNRIIAQWNKVSNVDNYILYMARTPNFSLILAERTITVLGNSVAVLNLLPVTYYFKVAAANSCGTSAPSNEVFAVVSNWPKQFKICKKDDPTICMVFNEPEDPLFVAQSCTGTNCDLTYVSNQHIKRIDKDVCLFDNNLPPPPVIEAPVYIKPCTSVTDWAIDLTSGRIISSNNLCLGADSISGTNAFNTSCASIANPDDSRYAWTVIPTTF